MVLILQKLSRKLSYGIMISIFIASFFYSIPYVLPQEDVTFIIGDRMMFTYFDPIVQEGFHQSRLDKWAYEPLYHAEWNDPDSEGVYIVPWLVESEESDESGLHITLNLRRNVRFWNGEELNAQVIKWNWERQKQVGCSWYGEMGSETHGIIQRFWYDLDAFLAVPGNAKYNDSSQYPELWWNKPWSRMPPSYLDGTNNTRLDPANWPDGVDDWSWWGPGESLWRGRTYWTPELVWNSYYPDIGPEYYYATGSWTTGGTRPMNAYHNCTLYPEDPYKITINLNLPVWPAMKAVGLPLMPMIYPDGTPTTDGYWEYDGDLFFDGGMAPVYYHGFQSWENYDKFIGTGCFQLTEVNDPEGYYSLTKNPNYWGGNWQDTNRPGPIDPAMDNLVVKYYDSDDPYYSAFLDAEIQFMTCWGEFLSYKQQIIDDEDTELLPPFALQEWCWWALNPQTIDHTIRHAMSFAFNYDHFMSSAVLDEDIVRNKGPFYNALYTDYNTQNLQWTFPGMTEPGYFYNLDEARRILLEDDAQGRAAARGLTASSTDADWQAVAASANPVDEIIGMSEAAYPVRFAAFETYMSNIGVKVNEYGPIAYQDVYPWELMMNRWVKDAWYCGTWYYTAPVLFDVIKWFLDERVTGDLTDPNDHYPSWNSFPYYSSEKTLNTEWAVSQGYTDYVPTSTNMRQAIFSLPFLSDEQQIMLDYGTIMDKVLRDAIFINIGTHNGYWAINSDWTTGGRALGPGDVNVYDFKPVGWTPAIPGFPLGILCGVSLVATLGLVIIVKKRKI
jgi:hypothetical protein